MVTAVPTVAPEDVTPANLANLPDYLQWVAANHGIDMARAEACVAVRTTLLDGVVGENPARLGARTGVYGNDGVIRVDCANNPEFWMEYDVGSGVVRGRVQGAAGRDGSFHVARAHDGVLQFTHTAAPAFFVHMRY